MKLDSRAVAPAVDPYRPLAPSPSTVPVGFDGSSIPRLGPEVLSIALGGAPWPYSVSGLRADGIIAQIATGTFPVPPAASVAGPRPASPSPDTDDRSSTAPRSSYAHQLLANSDHLGDGLSLLSGTFDLGAGGEDGATFGVASAGLSVAANALAFADKYQKGETFATISAGLKLTGGMVSLADKYVLTGTPYLSTVAVAFKVGSLFVKFIDPGKDD